MTAAHVHRTLRAATGLCLFVMAAPSYASRSTLAHAQAATTTREAREAHKEGKNMTELNAMGAPLKAPASRTPTEDTSIRPFRANVPDALVADLRRRLAETRW